MIKVITIIGARPQIIKAAAVSRAVKNHFSDKINEIIIHTGQHYDENMSQIFFEEMNIPRPDINLNVGSGSHGVQTAKMITGIEEILVNEKPHYLILYGDTNSTLAGAVAASKLHVPIVHIEAGLRSFNKKMPEEINRIMCDHASTLLFTPTQTGFSNLIKEGFSTHNKAPFTADNPGIFHCGDVMYDNSLFFEKQAKEKSTILKKLGLSENNFFLATVHRNDNTDQPHRLNALFEAFDIISRKSGKTVVLPLHPRTKKLLPINLKPEVYTRIISNHLIKLIPPVSFFDMITLESNCNMIFTDSGGVQKEAYFFKKPVVVMRSETEWKEIIDAGCGIVSNADTGNIVNAFNRFQNADNLFYPPIFGDGHASEFILKQIVDNQTDF
jgi:UDP-GlcNAc3NAcA epimerase